MHIPVFPPPVHSPYDTLEEVIGMRGTPGHGSLMEWGIQYREQPMSPDGSIDWEALKTAIVPGEGLTPQLDFLFSWMWAV